MKIINNGISKYKTPENNQENYWWMDYAFRCNCECVFKLEISDYPKLIQTSNDGSSVNLNCPHCNSRIRLTKPTEKNKWSDTELNTISLFENIFAGGGVVSKLFENISFRK